MQALTHRRIIEPNSAILVGGNPEFDRGFIRREINEWSTHPYLLPNNFQFTESDKRLGLASKQAWDEMQFKGPIHCNDAFIVRRTKSGEYEALTIVRQEWPLAGERWMIGGREITPPGDHPLANDWLPDHSMLLSMYREVNLQPADILRAYQLLDVQFNFKFPQDPTKMKQTPATLWVLEVSSEFAEQIDLKESKDALWLKLDNCDHHYMNSLRLCEYMKYALNKIKSGLGTLKENNTRHFAEGLQMPQKTED